MTKSELDVLLGTIQLPKHKCPVLYPFWHPAAGPGTLVVPHALSNICQLCAGAVDTRTCLRLHCVPVFKHLYQAPTSIPISRCLKAFKHWL